jgi:hypothetical protein
VFLAKNVRAVIIISLLSGLMHVTAILYPPFYDPVMLVKKAREVFLLHLFPSCYILFFKFLIFLTSMLLMPQTIS